MLKQKKSKKFIYILLAVLLAAVLFVSFSDVPVEQKLVEEDVRVKVQ